MFLPRPALLAGVRPNPGGAEEAQLRGGWLVHTGWELPGGFPHLLDVRFSVDEDDPVLTVPACCVWGQSGLFNVAGAALGKGGGGIHPALRHFASAPLAHPRPQICLIVKPQLSYQRMHAIAAQMPYCYGVVHTGVWSMQVGDYSIY